MTAETLDATLRKVRRRAEQDGTVVAALEVLADDDAADRDPFERPPEPLVATARSVNEMRRSDDREQLRRRSLTTAEVVEAVDGISGRAAVDRRRKRRRLIGVPDGRTTLHPGWQFSPRRRATHAGLTEVLDALYEHASAPAKIDALATAPQPDVAGASIADLLAAGQIDLAVQLAHMAGDQS